MNLKHRFFLAIFIIPIITATMFSAEVFFGKQTGSVEVASAYAADPALLESFKSILAKWNNIILNSKIVTPQKQTASVIETGPTYYVATNGSDTNSGSVSAPFATIQKAHDVAVPGDTIYVRGGTYNISKGIDFTRGGSSGKPIKLFAYPGEVPVLNASGIATVDTWVIKLRSGASWWHIKGLEIKNNPQGGGITLINSTNNNIIENNNIHHNGNNSEWAASGISVYDSPSNNLFLNNDLHNNQDIDNGDADGISAGNLGAGNVYRGNRMWQNSDDGIDFFCPSYSSNQTCGTVLLENNWSFENGYNEKHEALGNGNGFKLGGARPGLNNKSGGHTLKNNLTWGNLEGGYDDNNSNATLGNALPNTLYNNTAWNNGQNYVFWADVNHIFRNNINFGTLGHIYGSATNNSWTLPVTVNASDFSSIDDSCAKGPRQSDGSLPDCPFLKLISGSDLIDKGTNVGIPYSDTAPDLGAFEYQIASTPAPAPTSTPTDPNVIYPDVIISSLDYDQATGKFSVVVKNQGTKAVASGVTIGVGYHVDGKQQTWGDVLGPLEAGASVTIGTKGATYAIPAGTHSIMAWVDDANRFVESNETNNQLIKLVTIPTSGTTPVPTSTTTTQVPTSPTPTSTTNLNIFTENFETAFLWTKSSPVTWYTGSPKNGKYSVRLQKTGSITKTISTVGYKNIKVTFNIGANSLDNNNERLEVLYYDGSSWTLLTSIKNGNQNENNKLNPYLIALPTLVSNNPDFALRFNMVGSSTNDYGYIDDITVTGIR